MPAPFAQFGQSPDNRWCHGPNARIARSESRSAVALRVLITLLDWKCAVTDRLRPRSAYHDAYQVAWPLIARPPGLLRRGDELIRTGLSFRALINSSPVAAAYQRATPRPRDRFHRGLTRAGANASRDEQSSVAVAAGECVATFPITRTKSTGRSHLRLAALTARPSLRRHSARVESGGGVNRRLPGPLRGCQERAWRRFVCLRGWREDCGERVREPLDVAWGHVAGSVGELGDVAGVVDDDQSVAGAV